MALAAAVLFSGIGADSVTTVYQLIRNPPPKPRRTAADARLGRSGSCGRRY